ncbi:MAG: TAXI family TRAP transporter solute-binding subunit [Chloroflexi bacterium]|nr:TAXI family TRAP transporter solute-binding subunit [Chloroflexota bacterium]
MSASRAVPAFLFTLVLALTACGPADEGDGTGATDPTDAPTDGAATDGGGNGDGETTRLTIATGGTGGVYFPLGGGLAQELSENLDGVEATAQETSASVDNMLLIGTGDADVAFVLGDTAADAVEGRGTDFEGNAIDACTLGILYSNYTQLVTTPDSGIESVADLAGRRVSLGAPGSGTEVIAIRILEAAGIDPDADIDRSQLLVDETVDGLRDGTIDAGFWSGGLPTGALVDLASAGELALVPTAEYTSDLADEYGPFYLEREIPADTYDGVDEAVPTVVVPNVLVVNTSMDEELQRQITQVLFEQKDDLVDVHPAASELDAATAGEVEFMDVCPGAQAYYDEAG